MARAFSAPHGKLQRRIWPLQSFRTRFSTRLGPERKLIQVGKAGAYEFVDGTPEQFEIVTAETKKACEVSYASYEAMLEAGVAREVARIVLPVTIYSSAYVTMNARALMNFLSLRR